MISVSEVLMGRQDEYPLSIEQLLKLSTLMAAINYIRGVYGKPLIVTSGYRPGHYNKQAGGAKASAHLDCEAVDLYDPDREFTIWCWQNEDELEKAGLYMEDPEYTDGWVHLQTRAPRSGKRIFIP